MSIAINSNLKLICEEIALRCSSDCIFANNWELQQLLDTLSLVERHLLVDYFCALEWNIGSIRMLSNLQHLRMLTATQYIIRLPNAEEAQLIINDLLEAEPELLANLFISAHLDVENGVYVSDLLYENLQRLFKDLLKQPNLSDLNYLKALQQQLPAELFVKVMQQHLQCILHLHQSVIKEAFKHFSVWINEGVDDIKFVKDFYEKAICHNEMEVLDYMLKQASQEHFKQWKFYLILLQTIASHCQPMTSKHIKKQLKVQLQQVATSGCTKSMMRLLLTTRALTATSMDIDKNIMAYADWYKQNIGEMKFVLKPEEFKNMLTALSRTVNYEMETDYLEVHATVSISPPVLCGKLVQSYKTKCKLRLSQLKRNSVDIEPNESIPIDDSD